MNIAIFPSGLDESYYFTLDKYGALRCDLGRRKDDNIKQSSFLEIIEDSACTKLGGPDLQALINLANELEESGYDKERELWDDSWSVAVLFNGKIYEMDLWGQSNEAKELRNLADKIIELSPPDVDLRGFA